MLSFVCDLFRRFNKTIPIVTMSDAAASAPNPAMTPTAADESTIPFCPAPAVADAAPAAVLVDAGLLLDRVSDSSSAVTVTVCVGAKALMKAVAVTVGLVDPVSELELECSFTHQQNMYLSRDP